MPIPNESPLSFVTKSTPEYKDGGEDFTEPEHKKMNNQKIL